MSGLGQGALLLRLGRQRPLVFIRFFRFFRPIPMKTIGSILLALLLPAPAALAQTGYPHDLAVTHIYALDKLAQADAAPQVVRARIVNQGTLPVANATVSLRLTGANALMRTAAVPRLGPGDKAVVSFGAYPPGALGRQWLCARVSADDNLANDSVQLGQVVSADTASYVTPGIPSFARPGEFRMALVGGLGNRFAVGNAARQIRAVRAYVVHPLSVGLVLQGFVADRQTGRMLGRSAQRLVGPADIGSYLTFGLTDDVVLQNKEYIAGFFVVGRVGPSPRYEPMPWGFQLDIPQRDQVTYDVFYAGVGDTPMLPPLDTGGPQYGAILDTLSGKLMAEVITAPAPVCPRPANLEAVVRGGPFRVAFDSTYNALGYEVAYGPAGFDPDRATATGGRVVSQRRGPFSLSATLPDAPYQFYARARCAGGGTGAWAGPVGAMSPCWRSAVVQFPYREAFDALPPGQPLPCGTEVQDNDGNRTSWVVQSGLPIFIGQPPYALYQSPPNALYLNMTEAEFPVGGMADDWFFTPALALYAGHRYQLSFNARNMNGLVGPGTSPNKLAVWLGDAPDPARQTTLLYRNTQLNTAYSPLANSYVLADASSTPAVQPITVPVDGFYYLGFQAYNQQIDNGMNDRLLLDDLEVADAGPLSARAPAWAALCLVPNPSADGRFELALPGPVSAGPWAVQVTNAIGQTVYEAKNWAAGQHQLDLSGRPAGVYVVRVCGRAGCVARRVVVGP